MKWWVKLVWKPCRRPLCLLNECGWLPGVGITTVLFVNFFARWIYDFAKIQVRFFVSLSYMTGINASEMRRVSMLAMVLDIVTQLQSVVCNSIQAMVPHIPGKRRFRTRLRSCKSQFCAFSRNYKPRFVLSSTNANRCYDRTFADILNAAKQTSYLLSNWSMLLWKYNIFLCIIPGYTPPGIFRMILWQ